MHTKLSYDTVWTIEHIDPNKRFAMKSQPVEANAPVIIEHCGTSHLLASDLIEYRNDFGIEYEVCVHSYATLNKSQSLALEKEGKLTRDLPTKFQQDQNIWVFVLSNDPKTDFDSIPEKPIDPAEFIKEIKKILLQRGSYGLRGLAKLFKNMDKNGNHKLDPEEFMDALQTYGILIDKKGSDALFNLCDKNKDGSIDYTEFLRFLRGNLNETRKAIIAQAYAKLDKTGDGKITLDDIAKTYSVKKHPDVISRKKTEEQVYKECLANWDTEIADGIVTLEEFQDYYKDLSALIDKDDYFVAIVKSAWNL